ncbi:MAG: glycerol-3-phosphate dehydrogenase/oxidase [Micropruina sp.]
MRYLQTYQFGLVAESLRERERMLKLAPHLTEVRPFLYLLYRGYPESKLLLNLGLTYYDAASGEWLKRRHRMLSARQVLQREPHLAADGLRGAGLYYDVLTDDARLTLDTAKGAAEAGARLLNHAAVTGLVLERGRPAASRSRTSCRGGVRRARPAGGERHRPLDGTGPALLESGPVSGGRLRPTKGVHIVVRKSDFPLTTAVFLRSPDDNRVVWPTPSLEDDVVYIGTTDTDYTGDPDAVQPDEADIRYLLNVANRTIPEARLTERHVVGSWAGLRPLIAPEPGTSTGNTPREHAISEGPTGMLTISGGKLTSNRVMAKHLVDAVLARTRTAARKYTADRVPISGGSRLDRDFFLRRARAAGVPPEIAGAWVRRYGSNAIRLLELWNADPRGRDMIGPRGLTRAEVRYCVREEMCAGLNDLLVRRTSLFFWDAGGGLDGIEEIAAELGGALAWSPERRQGEIDAYRALVRAHRPG